MDDEARIARLTALAKRVWDDDTASVYTDRNGHASVTRELGVEPACKRYRVLMLDHPRALDMLEATLLVGAGDAPLVAAGQGAMSKLAEPAWVQRLAREWESTAAQWRGNHEHYDGE
jgi:hypothetical protein